MQVSVSVSVFSCAQQRSSTTATLDSQWAMPRGKNLKNSGVQLPQNPKNVAPKFKKNLKGNLGCVGPQQLCIVKGQCPGPKIKKVGVQLPQNKKVTPIFKKK